VSGAGHVKANIGGRDRVVAEVSGWSKGDAFLIAAAPAMYAALEAAVLTGGKSLDLARAALARARGEEVGP
jgi:hypothetical protein